MKVRRKGTNEPFQKVALEGLNANPEYALNSEDKIAIVAVNCVDALVEKLKGE